MISPKLIVANNLCIGCGFCENLFKDEGVKMLYNEAGFLYPKFLSNVILPIKKLDIFNKVCPSVSAFIHNSKTNNVFFGPIIQKRNGYSSDPIIRHKASSGGALSALSIYLLENKIVECVVHIGVDSSNPLINKVCISFCKEDIIRNSGSRYSPSAPLVNIDSILDSYNSICFIGKPCDVLAMRNYMSINSLAQDRVKCILSFMCAGIPSLSATRRIINKLNFEEVDVKSIRYRGDGWPGYFTVEGRDGRKEKMSYNETWGTILNKELHFRCKICADGTGEFADITCADSWEKFKNGYPQFEEADGKSLIISRTEIGESLIRNAVESQNLKIEKKNVNLEEIIQMQPYQVQRKKGIIPRLVAMSLFRRKFPRYNWYLLFIASIKGNPVYFLKNFFGMVRRILR